MMNSVKYPLPPGRGEFKQAAAQLHSELQIQGLTADSRDIKQGDTFVAYKGERVDGRDYIADAIERGAQSVIWDPEGFDWPVKWQAISHRSVTNLKDNISVIAAEVYGNPSQQLRVTGVTGTNGKSSCSLWLAQLLSRIDGNCAVMGTLGNGIWPHLSESQNTTADAIECQKWLKSFVDQHCKDCVMEVSSHGLVQGRVGGVNFTGAIFTNLTRDHLDYHGTMEAYAEAKALLFQAQGLQWAVINYDDEFGKNLLNRYRTAIPQVIGYSLTATDNPGILSAFNIRLSAQGAEFDFSFEGKTYHVSSPLLGRFNVANLLAVLAALICLDINLNQVVGPIASLNPPPGRLEKIISKNGFVAVIDYAHTPDALEQVLITLREITPTHNNLICVFGCGGNRDKGKRSLMGKVVDQFADQIIVTNDNPRDEEPEEIIHAIQSGIAGVSKAILDRREAIEYALSCARPGDVVLVAGKGHEDYQEVKGVKHYFSDQQVVKEYLQRSEG